jgi:hypothetical protein
MADVLELEAEAAVAVGVTADRPDDGADESDVPAVTGDRARRELRDAVPGERRVDDEDRESGRHRESDHEPRRT